MSFKHSMASYSDAILQSPKAALTVSGGTVATGSATWWDLLPSDIGFYASAVGIVLSLVFIYNNIRGGIIKRKLDRAEYELMIMRKAKTKAELEKLGRPWADR